MDSLRLATSDRVIPPAPCCRCGADGCHWDQIAGSPYCPDCQESLARGVAAPLVARTEPKRCAVCRRGGTVPFVTFPLHAPAPLEIALCPDHFRALLGRCLATRAFRQIRRQLEDLGMCTGQVFLLHEVFYDDRGRALRPAADAE